MISFSGIVRMKEMNDGRYILNEVSLVAEK